MATTFKRGLELAPISWPPVLHQMSLKGTGGVICHDLHTLIPISYELTLILPVCPQMSDLSRLKLN